MAETASLLKFVMMLWPLNTASSCTAVSFIQLARRWHGEEKHTVFLVGVASSTRFPREFGQGVSLFDVCVASLLDRKHHQHQRKQTNK